MEERNILELKHISKQYTGVKALDDVSISFRRGEVHALMGENGAGKSTLIKTLSGAIQPNDGEIVFEKVFRYITLSLSASANIGSAGFAATANSES